MMSPGQLWQPIRTSDRWLFCVALALCATVSTYWPHALAALRYDRAGLLAGQYWRVASGHLVHLNGAHLLLNLAGLFLLCELLWNDLSLRHGAGALVFGAMAASALLFWFDPDLGWYAGLSGALHGLWAACALAGLLPQNRLSPPHSSMPATTPTSTWWRLWCEWPLTRRVGLGGLALLLVKLLAEARWGGSAWTSGAIGAPLVARAHLYGAFGGGLYLLLVSLGSRLRPATSGRRRQR